MKKFLIIASLFLLSGCSTIDTVKKYWPRNHDPVMFKQLVDLDIAIEKQDCNNQTWKSILDDSERLVRYAEWRDDPQSTNLRGLKNHLEKMSQGGSKSYCEIGKKLAQQRISIAKNAWKGR